MAKINKVNEVLQSAEFSKNQVPVSLRSGSFVDKNDVERNWVHLDCVDETMFTHAEELGIDPQDLPTILVKIKNPDGRNWEDMINETISVVNATVIPVISNNQLKELALSIDSSEL